MTKTNMTFTSLTPKQRTEILASVKKGVLKHHFNVGGVDYDEWARRFDERSASLLGVDIDEFEGGVRKALAELGSSHTVFYHERTNRLLPQHSINATIRAFGHDGRQRWHFLDVFEGGPAHLAGIKSGDTLGRRRRDAIRTSDDAPIQNRRDPQDYCLQRDWRESARSPYHAYRSEKAPRTAHRLSNPRARSMQSLRPKPGSSRFPISPAPQELASRIHSTWQFEISRARAATASSLICAEISAAVWVSPALRAIFVLTESRSATA